MAVYKYQASLKNREEHIESGTIVAANEFEAKEKLKKLEFGKISIKKLGTFKGIFKKFSADIR